MSREEKPTMQRRGVGVAGVLGPYTVERGWHPVHGCGVDVDWAWAVCCQRRNTETWQVDSVVDHENVPFWVLLFSSCCLYVATVPCLHQF